MGSVSRQSLPLYVATGFVGLVVIAAGAGGTRYILNTPSGASATANIATWTGTGSNPAGVAIRANSDITGSGRIISESGSSLGWQVISGANTKCNTTCVHACVFGVNTAATEADITTCEDATSDECLCAGAS